MKKSPFPPKKANPFAAKKTPAAFGAKPGAKPMPFKKGGVKGKTGC